MNPVPVRSIEEVILALKQIIQDAKAKNNPMGYFAALYLKVTVKVKEGIANGRFEDGPRMERLDCVFAQRYLHAYEQYQNQQHPSLSWLSAFDLTTQYWPIVLQHLLAGINAHINLDLGIAAAEISKGKDLQDLKNDFDKINEILSELVHEVEADLSAIWPRLKWILQKTSRVDDFLVDFSMELARDGAWKFAESLAKQPAEKWEALIVNRDQQVARKARIISHPGKLIQLILALVRLGERGTVTQKIEQLEQHRGGV